MEHRGEIVKKAIEKSGFSITHIAKKLNRSRQWVYDQFDNPNLSIETVLKIGKIIQYDFSLEIKNPHLFLEPKEIYESKNEIIWKNKYYSLLEEYNSLLKKYNQLIEAK